jgi:hypothetical protein
MRTDKPALGYFHCFIDQKDIKTEGTGEDATHQLSFIIHDEFFIAPAPWSPETVEISFDGGAIKLTRESFQQLLKDYEARYQKDIHHSAIAELQKAVEALPTEQAQRFKDVLSSMERVLDATREPKRK